MGNLGKARYPFVVRLVGKMKPETIIFDGERAWLGRLDVTDRVPAAEVEAVRVSWEALNRLGVVAHVPDQDELRAMKRGRR